MQIINTGQINNSYSSSSTSSSGATAPFSPTTSNLQFDPANIALANAFTQATILGEALNDFTILINAAQPQRNQPAWARSTESLQLDGGAGTPTTLSSTEEVNATPTSFTPRNPDWIEPSFSSAAATIGGVYDGSNGTDTLTFKAKKTGIHGINNLEFEVEDLEGNKIQTIDVEDSDPLDQEYLLVNGLTFTLGEGSIVKNEEFTIEVFDSIGGVVDPDQPFNGVGDNQSNLQEGFSVIAGGFDINGVNITVNADDTINEVLASITASGAGVNAVFDVVTERVLLEQTTPGPTYDIIISNDTSGFIAATKLDNAISVPGIKSGMDTVLNMNPQFSAVISGTVLINSVEIDIDINTDSLDDILDRINASDAGVLTKISANRVNVLAQNENDLLTIDDGGTGFFDTLAIQSGIYKPRIRNGISDDQANEIAEAALKIKSAANQLLDNTVSGTAAPAQITNLKNQVQSILNSANANLHTSLKDSMGLTIEADGSGIELDLSKFLNSLGSSFSDVKQVFVGEAPNSKQGFVRELLRVVNNFTTGLRAQYGGIGFLRNLYA